MVVTVVGKYKSSALGNICNAKKLNLPGNKAPSSSRKALLLVLVADAALPLKNNLMRPHAEADVVYNEHIQVFNCRQCHARRVAENAFDLITGQFKWYSTKYNILHKHVYKTVLATVAMHNFF
ncbi:hypothetical protein PR048_016458 [Dryococelus australis]|uniref:DDE Tnp4 domain-containing protein n=1 Tax=Dryococelus australis TaxID=614101 RepID=A0ABQ9HKB8_9NEOP|nr:hypothetical protein PR048_016458 [Dryococelus australis]